MKIMEHQKKKDDIRGCHHCAKSIDLCQGLSLCAKTKEYIPVVYFCKLPGGYEQPEAFPRKQEDTKKYRDHAQEKKYAMLIDIVPAVGWFTYMDCPPTQGITDYGWVRALDGMVRRGMLIQVGVKESTEKNRAGARIYEKVGGAK